MMLRVLTLVMTLVTFTAKADGLQYVPKWHMQNGEACYGFDDAKKLVEVDVRLVDCTERTRLHLVQIEQLQLALTETQEALRLSKTEAEVWKKRSDEFEAEYRKKIVELKESEVKRHSNTPLYVIAGAVILVGGVIVGVSLR